jgi:hypothetical protein
MPLKTKGWLLSEVYIYIILYTKSLEALSIFSIQMVLISIEDDSQYHKSIQMVLISIEDDSQYHKSIYSRHCVKKNLCAN